MKIAVIGCGNMASAVVKQLHKSNKDIKFYTYTPSITRAKSLAEEVNGTVVEDFNSFEIDLIDYWLIGCKPQQVDELAKNMSEKLKDKVIVSMLAATSVEKLSRVFKTNKIIRIMPNTPIALGLGVTLVKSSDELDGLVKDKFLNSLEAGSYIIETKTEKELDELTVFSGSGPAYVFYFAYTLEQKLLNMGYEQAMCRELINNLFVGSSALMKDTSSSLSDLVDQVTSKGGVTIEAIKEYRSNDLGNISSKAIEQALKRTDEITQLLK